MPRKGHSPEQILN